MFASLKAGTRRKVLTRLAALVSLGIAGAVAGPSAWATTGAATGEPLYFGVSGPLTGPNAQYGTQWKAGFELAPAHLP